MEAINAGKGISLVRLGTGFTDSSEAGLSSLLEASINRADRWFALDFSEVTAFDNTGIDTLVKLSVRVKNRGVRLIATGLSTGNRNIFIVCRLDRDFHIDSPAPCPLSSASAAACSAESKGEDRLKDPNWASPVRRLLVPQMPDEAVNLNVNGRRISGPLQGFGQLWEKTYRIDVTDAGLEPVQILDAVKKHFALLQPRENRFYPSVNGIKPGEIVLINALTPGGLVATGVLVLYAGDTTFTLITPQGHPEAGWVTFKAFKENGRTIMQIRGLARASDPVYELAFRIAGSNLQQNIWTHVLKSLADQIASSGKVEFHRQCIDSSLQWTRFFNVFQNAQMLSMLYTASHPRKKFE